MRAAGLTLLGIAASLLTAGCDDSEAGRTPHFAKAVHLGGTSAPLSTEARESLAGRVMLQRGAVALNQPLSPASLPAEGASAAVEGRIAGQRY